jgi:hypothetical protein
MDTQYNIVLALRTPNGTETIAKFFLGNNEKPAHAVFKKLDGNQAVSEKDLIFMDFVETKNGLPGSMDMITCTLDQLAENCKIITKELFKLKSLSLIS